MAQSHYKRLLPLLIIVSVLSACEREEEDHPHDHGHQAHTVDLRLAFVFKYGTHNYELASEYTDDFGHVYKLDRVRFFVSDMDVVDDYDEVLAEYPDVRLLVDAEQPTNDFALGSLTASHAHQIRFTMGLEPQLNDADPDTCASPLNDNAMHWGMGADEGFWFLVAEGRVDSDSSGAIDGPDQTFSYRCGTDALLRNGWAIMHTQLPDGGAFTVEAIVDVEKLMGGVDVLNNLSATGGTPLNLQLMDSLDANFHEAH